MEYSKPNKKYPSGHAIGYRCHYPVVFCPQYRRTVLTPQRQADHYPQARRIEIPGQRIRLPKMGWVKTLFHRPLRGKAKNVTVSKTKTGQSFVSFQVEREMPDPQPKAGQVGVDLGLKSYLALSSDETLPNPGHLLQGERRLKKLQRDYARTQRGRRGREKARRRLARQHDKASNQRRDFQHQLSRTLIARYGVIDRWYPSTKTGSHCLRERTELPLRVRQWQCPNCGVVHARDGNATKTLPELGSSKWKR
jgi:putative transposase